MGHVWQLLLTTPTMVMAGALAADPYPHDNVPSDTQYAMIGEFGGIGAFIPGREWRPGQCHTYLPAINPAQEASDCMLLLCALGWTGCISHASTHWTRRSILAGWGGGAVQILAWCKRWSP
jgi:hypothetical protein